MEKVEGAVFTGGWVDTADGGEEEMILLFVGFVIGFAVGSTVAVVSVVYLECLSKG